MFEYELMYSFLSHLTDFEIYPEVPYSIDTKKSFDCVVKKDSLLIGFQAKLQTNDKLLKQCIEGLEYVDYVYAVVLSSKLSNTFKLSCISVGVGIVDEHGTTIVQAKKNQPHLKDNILNNILHKKHGEISGVKSPTHFINKRGIINNILADLFESLEFEEELSLDETLSILKENKIDVSKTRLQFYLDEPFYLVKNSIKLKYPL